MLRVLGTGLALALLCSALSSLSSAQQIHFRLLDRAAVETRLRSFSLKDPERETILKQMFLDSGCKPANISEQAVKAKQPPNLICVLPGETSEIILVGAHFDHVAAGDGVVDNWSGASLLPSLLYSLNELPRRHTFVFVSFAAEEQNLVGSNFYAQKLTPEERRKIHAMVNLDTLGLGSTEVWTSHADKPMLDALIAIAHALKLPIQGMNVDGVGSSDSESFAKIGVPRVTIHSLTTETLPVLHSKQDKLSAMKLNDYYESYHLLAGYLAYLDVRLDPLASPAAGPGADSNPSHPKGPAKPDQTGAAAPQ